MINQNKSYKAALTSLEQYVRAHEGMRPSRVRNMVLEQVCLLPQPFTAEQLLKACEAQRITVGTVYNALNLFLDANLVHATKRQRGLSATEYELTTGPNNRFEIICRKCGRVAEVRDPVIVQTIMERKYSNFNAQHFSLSIYGECKICRRKQIRKQIK